MPTELVPPSVMARVDAATIAHGTGGRELMLNAGRSVARAVIAAFPPQHVLALCGPGNNGGDGFVAARLLHNAGWAVRVACIIPQARLRDDAAWAASLWGGPVEALGPETLGEATLVIDALFGAGLTRPLEGEAAAVVSDLDARGLHVVSVDIPSGVDGATGEIAGAAVRADRTVTFGRAKPGHLLLPGRLRCGRLEVADIGLIEEALAEHDVGLRANRPRLWRHLLPRREPGDHKYRFGHAVVVAGPIAVTGAARLAATAALRVGAGLASIACETDALPVYAAGVTTVMTKPFVGLEGLRRLLSDSRLNAVLIGPGRGVGEATREEVMALLALGRPLVLDADALTSFADHRTTLLEALHPDVVLTPHDGEFARLFPVCGDRLTRARSAAVESGCIVLLKGNDTVVAAPDGRAAISNVAPPTLATAGTGDVLGGLVLGLLAQGMPAFEAACAAVWIHAAAAQAVGGPLIAEDLPPQVPEVLTRLVALGEGQEKDEAAMVAENFGRG
jgi:NAD(P)H-hydrate epimerase